MKQKPCTQINDLTKEELEKISKGELTKEQALQRLSEMAYLVYVYGDLIKERKSLRILLKYVGYELDD